jgi:glycogen synthase
MKILMTADTIGGVWSYALELCAALRAHDVEIALATLGGPLSSGQRRAVGALDHVSLHESVFRLEWMPDPWQDVREAGEWLLAVEREFQPDVVHLNHLAHGDSGWSAPVLQVGHSCVLSWWEAVRRAPLPQEWAQYRERVTLSIRAADYVVAPTRAMLSLLQQHYGPLKQSRAILNARSSRGYGPAPKEPFVLAAGRLWDEAKNVAALSAVAACLPWPIYVAGAPEGPGCGTTLAGGGLQALGHLEPPALAQYYARAAIYALPARYEPFGLTALEAALSGCALVLGDIPSLREVWGDAAHYVPPDDHEALRAVLGELIADRSMRSQWATRALLRAGQFSPDAFARDYLDIYRTLTHARSRAGEVRTQTTAALAAAAPAG